eukprot:Amastigsp_a6511_5.p1 type:complete len:150 gc:universal Amastigsp_a6511_5:922-1371(+)
MNRPPNRPQEWHRTSSNIGIGGARALSSEECERLSDVSLRIYVEKEVEGASKAAAWRFIGVKSQRSVCRDNDRTCERIGASTDGPEELRWVGPSEERRSERLRALESMLTIVGCAVAQKQAAEHVTLHAEFGGCGAPLLRQKSTRNRKS